MGFATSEQCHNCGSKLLCIITSVIVQLYSFGHLLLPSVSVQLHCADYLFLSQFCLYLKCFEHFCCVQTSLKHFYQITKWWSNCGKRYLFREDGCLYYFGTSLSLSVPMDKSVEQFDHAFVLMYCRNVKLRFSVFRAYGCESRNMIALR